MGKTLFKYWLAAAPLDASRLPKVRTAATEAASTSAFSTILGAVRNTSASILQPLQASNSSNDRRPVLKGLPLGFSKLAHREALRICWV